MYADLAPRLCQKGWPSVIPIVRHEKRPAINAWQHYGASPPTPKVLAALVKAYPKCGVGFVFGGGGVLAVDLDITDLGLALDAGMVTFDILGETPLIRVGQLPKRLLVYRAEPGLQVAGKAFGGFEIFHGSGQCVFYGRHPAGFDYTWPNKSPLEIAPKDLPVVTAAKIARLIDALKVLTGGSPKGGAVAGAVNGGQGGCSDRTSGVVAKIMPILRQVSDPLTKAAEIVAGAEAGDRYPSMFGVVVSLATLGYTDAEILRTVSGPYFAHFDPDEAQKRTYPFTSAIKWARRTIGADRFQAEKFLHPDFAKEWSE